jgi:hypothetical protein
MKDIFKDLLGTEGVHGLIVISDDGDLLLSKFSVDFRYEEEKLGRIGWGTFAVELTGVREAELIYDTARFYIKKGGAGYLIVILSDEAPVSMVRLSCEALLPSLDKMKSTGKSTGKRISRILRKKIF